MKVVKESFTSPEWLILRVKCNNIRYYFCTSLQEVVSPKRLRLFYMACDWPYKTCIVVLYIINQLLILSTWNRNRSNQSLFLFLSCCCSFVLLFSATSSKSLPTNTYSCSHEWKTGHPPQAHIYRPRFMHTSPVISLHSPLITCLQCYYSLHCLVIFPLHIVFGDDWWGMSLVASTSMEISILLSPSSLPLLNFHINNIFIHRIKNQSRLPQNGFYMPIQYIYICIYTNRYIPIL